MWRVYPEKTIFTFSFYFLFHFLLFFSSISTNGEDAIEEPPHPTPPGLKKEERGVFNAHADLSRHTHKWDRVGE
jgi:hypothetical protein